MFKDRLSRFQQSPFMIGFKCPACNSRIDLKYVVEVDKEFMCEDCSEKSK